MNRIGFMLAVAVTGIALVCVGCGKEKEEAQGSQKQPQHSAKDGGDHAGHNH